VSDAGEPDDTFQRVDVARLGSSVASMVLFATTYGLPLLAAIAMASGRPETMGGLLLLWPPAVLLVFFFAASKGLLAPVGRAANVHVAPSGIIIDGQLIPRSAIARATIVADPNLDGFRVVLDDKRALRGKHTLLTEDEATGQTIVTTLGLDVTRSTAAWSTQGAPTFSRRIDAIMILTAIVALSFCVTGALMSWPIVALLPVPVMLAVFALRLVKGSAVVGTDGVRVEWMGLSRYCAFSDVEQVRPSASGVRLVKKDKTHFDVTLVDEGKATRDPYGTFSAEVRALQDRIHQAMSLPLKARGPGASIDPYLRHDRSAGDWLASLRRVFGAASNLRVATTTEEAAWQVVLDQSTADEARVGAAAAIAVNGDANSREKLRAVAETVADTRVRVALEAAATGDEQAMVEAMANVVAQKKG